MSSHRAALDDNQDLLTDGFVAKRSALLRRVQEGAQRIVAAQLASGHPVFSSGLGDEADRLYLHAPDGRHCEYRVRADGGREVVRDGAP